MDSAHVSLVALKLNESGFESYRCDKPITLGINLLDFAKILKMAMNDDTLTLRADEDNSYLQIQFVSKKNDRSVEYLLNLLNIEAEALGIPDTEYPTYIKMSSGEFTKITKELSVLSEVVNIEVTGKQAKFTFSGKSGSGNIILKANTTENGDDDIEIECDEKVSSTYGLQYLTGFAKASGLTNRIGLYLSSSFPLMIEYDIEKIGYIKFFLAPKMDDEDQNN